MSKLEITPSAQNLWDRMQGGEHILESFDKSLPLRSLEEKEELEAVIEWLMLKDIEPKDEGAYRALEGLQDLANASNAFASWIGIEKTALLPSQNGKSKWGVRAAALREIDESSSRPQPNSWLSAFALGRLKLHLAESHGRDVGAKALKTVMRLLNEADQAFAELDGVDYLKATVSLLRGRAAAWRNDVIGATAHLSLALAQFRSLGNKLREADACYEMGMANLDTNNLDAAEALFTVAVEIYRLNEAAFQTFLARALQSRARTRVSLAQRADAEDRTDRLNAAKQDALAALQLASPRGAQPELTALGHEDLISQSQQDIDAPYASALSTGDGFRAAMAARDLAEIELVKLELKQISGTEHARLWWKFACKQGGAEHLFNPLGSSNFRTLLDAPSNGFTALRLAQLELDILARESDTDAESSAPLLIEIGKRFLARDEFNYAIEAFHSAANAYERISQSDHTAYWRFRASRLASIIGYRLPAPQGLVGSASSSLLDAAHNAAQLAGSDIHHIHSMERHRLSCEIAPLGRHGMHWMHFALVSQPPTRSQVFLSRLQDVMSRGDIAHIWQSDAIEGPDANTSYLYVQTEKVSGRPLSDFISGTNTSPTKLQLASKLCKAASGLIIAHQEGFKDLSPVDRCLWLTPDEIFVQPGKQIAIKRFGRLHGLRAPHTGWSALYAPSQKGAGLSPDRADAIAVARIVRLLAGDLDTTTSQLWLRSYLRRSSWVFRNRRQDELSLETVKAVERLAGGRTNDNGHGAGDLLELGTLLSRDAAKLERKGSLKSLY